MYPTRTAAGQQESLFPSVDARPGRPYRVPVYRVTLVRESRLPHTQPQIRSSRDAAVLFRQHLGNVDREFFMVAMLDQKGVPAVTEQKTTPHVQSGHGSPLCSLERLGPLLASSRSGTQA